MSRIADGVAECRRAARDELRKGATQIKIVASGGVASPYDPIWNLQYSEEEVRAIVEEARAWHTYVMAHAYSPEAIRRSIDFGVRSIEHANLIDRATAEHVAAADAFVVPTLVTYDALHRFGTELGFPEVSMGKLGAVREAGRMSRLPCGEPNRQFFEPTERPCRLCQLRLARGRCRPGGEVGPRELGQQRADLVQICDRVGHADVPLTRRRQSSLISDPERV